jgi:hypothetical protein
MADECDLAENEVEKEAEEEEQVITAIKDVMRYFNDLEPLSGS